MTSSKSNPLKSILKQSSSLANNATNTHEVSREQRIRDTALHHAQLLQDRKDIEAQILASVEELMELPSAPDADPARPSEDDRSKFFKGLALFQVSDYDALIQERNIGGSCGYALCPRPRKLQGTTAPYRIVGGRRREDDLRVLPRAELEKWCSSECAQRALYIRVQLSEQPAWARAETKEARFALYRETSGRSRDGPLAPEPERSSLADDMKHLTVEDHNQTPTSGFPDPPMLGKSRSFELPIREKKAMAVVSAPQVDGSSTTNAHLEVEGYEPGSTKHSRRSGLSAVDRRA